MLIYVVISGDRNLIKIEAEKVLKYNGLSIEMRRMCNVQAKVIPLIIGATGNISESLKQYPGHIAGKHEIKELQTTAILCTAYTLREVLT